MAKRKMTYEEIQRELKQRQAVESARGKKIKRYQEKQALMKKVKDLRFKQSKIGRTVTAGKVVFGRIGAVTKEIGKGFERTTKNVGKSQQVISKPQKALIGKPAIATPLKKKKKPFNLNEAIAKLPQ